MIAARLNIAPLETDSGLTRTLNMAATPRSRLERLVYCSGRGVCRRSSAYSLPPTERVVPVVELHERAIGQPRTAGEA